MREIKFRAWRKAFDETTPAEMFEHDPSGNLIVHAMAAPDLYTLLQFTGLKDKNGKEIYEGDLLGSDDLPPLLVSWKDGGFGYMLRKRFISFAGHNYLGEVLEFSTVIGNIYENPDLLAGQGKD